jgi:adenylylsulfate kinase
VTVKTAPVFWITGLSGSGKTTIAQALTNALSPHVANIVLLDGDHLREVFSGLFGHDRSERLRASQCYGRLCKMLSDQGITVVCSTISLFHDTQAWNRSHIPEYIEVYVKVPLEVLEARDSKQIYSRARAGELRDVIGIDIPAEEPLNPDIVIENHGDNTVADAMQTIMQFYHRYAANTI